MFGQFCGFDILNLTSLVSKNGSVMNEAENVLNVVYCMDINSSFLELFQSYFLIYSRLIVKCSLDVRKKSRFFSF